MDFGPRLSIRLVDVTHDRRGIRVAPGQKAVQFGIASVHGAGEVQHQMSLSQATTVAEELAEMVRCAEGLADGAIPRPRDIHVQEISL